MRNVLLINRDWNLELYKVFINIKNINIVGICVENEMQKKQIQSIAPHINIFTATEIANWDKSYISQKDIIRYQSTQLKVERYGSRLTTHYPNLILQYYQSLSFWLHFFQEHTIDMVFVGQIEHGSPVDSIPLDVAKEINIPAFLIQIEYANRHYQYYSIVHYNRKKYINLKNIARTKEDIKIEEILGYTHTKYNTGKQKEINRCTTTISLGYNIFCGILGRKRKQNMQGITYTHNYHKNLRNIFAVLRLKKYYKKLSVSSIPEKEDFVLYALHFEPEATIMNRTCYNNQLYNIKMLSSSLPRNWTLYVKEHPQQYNYHSLLAGDFLSTIDQYRYHDYYNELLKLTNVKLLDANIPSKEILQRHNSNLKGLKAIATINGTIALESTYHNIPTILFDGESTVTSKIENCFSVEYGQEQLLDILQDIESCSNRYNHNHYNTISQYVLSSGDNLTNDLENIISYLVSYNNNQ